MSEPCHNLQCKMESEIREIHLAVCGDEKHGHRGLVKRMEAVEKKTDWLYTKLAVIIGVAAALAAVWKTT